MDIFLSIFKGRKTWRRLKSEGRRVCLKGGCRVKGKRGDPSRRRKRRSRR